MTAPEQSLDYYIARENALAMARLCDQVTQKRFVYVHFLGIPFLRWYRPKTTLEHELASAFAANIRSRYPGA